MDRDTSSDNLVWLPAPSDLRLSDNTVHVWRASLAQPTEVIERMAGILSADEHARAARFFLERDQRSFTVARGTLRMILGRYLAVDGRELSFQYNEYGKPSLAQPFNGASLRFNLSHSRGLALFAITSNRDVGVDVEGIRTLAHFAQIAARMFSVYENAVLRSLPPSIQLEAFFNCWTRKEAYIKARGTGLSLPLDQFDVSFAPGEPARLIAIRNEPHEMTRWTLHALLPGHGYVGALVVEGEGLQVMCWQAIL